MQITLRIKLYHIRRIFFFKSQKYFERLRIDTRVVITIDTMIDIIKVYRNISNLDRKISTSNNYSNHVRQLFNTSTDKEPNSEHLWKFIYLISSFLFHSSRFETLAWKLYKSVWRNMHQGRLNVSSMLIVTALRVQGKTVR